jgi:hypothetical protein
MEVWELLKWDRTRIAWWCQIFSRNWTYIHVTYIYTYIYIYIYIMGMRQIGKINNHFGYKPTLRSSCFSEKQRTMISVTTRQPDPSLVVSRHSHTAEFNDSFWEVGIRKHKLYHHCSIMSYLESLVESPRLRGAFILSPVVDLGHVGSTYVNN